MTLLEAVEIAREQGHLVEYYTRKDGSIRVTRIDGYQYLSSESHGNQVLRRITGTNLSERKVKQLDVLRKSHYRLQSRVRGKKSDYQKLPPEVRAAYREMRKNIRGRDAGVNLKRKTLVNLYKREGKKNALQTVRGITRTALGLTANYEIIHLREQLILRLRPLQTLIHAEMDETLKGIIESAIEALERALAYLEEGGDTLTYSSSTFKLILDAIYELDRPTSAFQARYDLESAGEISATADAVFYYVTTAGVNI